MLQTPVLLCPVDRCKLEILCNSCYAMPVTSSKFTQNLFACTSVQHDICLIFTVLVIWVVYAKFLWKTIRHLAEYITYPYKCDGYACVQLCWMLDWKHYTLQIICFLVYGDVWSMLLLMIFHLNFANNGVGTKRCCWHQRTNGGYV